MDALAHQLKNVCMAVTEGFGACVQQQTAWYIIITCGVP